MIAKFVKQAGRERAKQSEERTKKRKESTREKIIARKLEEIQIGSRVRMKGSREAGEVQELKGPKAKVIFGNWVTEVSVENLEALP